jgi:hypothetical protein
MTGPLGFAGAGEAVSATASPTAVNPTRPPRRLVLAAALAERGEAPMVAVVREADAAPARLPGTPRRIVVIVPSVGCLTRSPIRRPSECPPLRHRVEFRESDTELLGSGI